MGIRWARLLDYGELGWPSVGLAGCSCAGSLRQALLAAGVLDDEGGGAALVAATLLTGRGPQVLAGAADETLHQVVEQMPGEEHVDPGVTAAVETGQQHGNDEGHVCNTDSTKHRPHW